MEKRTNRRRRHSGRARAQGGDGRRSRQFPTRARGRVADAGAALARPHHPTQRQGYPGRQLDSGKPAAVRASAKEASLETACLSSAPTRLCAQGQWNQSGDFSGRVQLSDLNPERFKRFLPQNTTLATHVNGEASASGKIGGALQAKANLNVAPAAPARWPTVGPSRSLSTPAPCNSSLTAGPPTCKRGWI